MFENKSYIKIKASTERSFGFVFATFFLKATKKNTPWINKLNYLLTKSSFTLSSEMRWGWGEYHMSTTRLRINA